MSTLFSGCSLSDVRTSRAGGSLAAMAPATRSSGACISREARGRGQGDGEGRTGRRAHSSSSFVRPGGSAHRRSTESPSSRAWLMIGDDWAGRAYHPKWSRTEACRCTAARLRALRSTCAAQCNGAAGHHEGKVWRRRRRSLGWAQGVCRAGRTIGGSISRREFGQTALCRARRGLPVA